MKEQEFNKYFEKETLWQKIQEVAFGKITIEVHNKYPRRVIEEKADRVEE